MSINIGDLDLKVKVMFTKNLVNAIGVFTQEEYNIGFSY